VRDLRVSWPGAGPRIRALLVDRGGGGGVRCCDVLLRCASSPGSTHAHDAEIGTLTHLVFRRLSWPIRVVAG